MVCKIHGQPKSMTCSRCGDTMCPMCAEYIDGTWFCSHCALKERRIAAGIEYQDLIAIGFGDPGSEEPTGEGDITEF
jgi:hypothetical protein